MGYDAEARNDSGSPSPRRAFLIILDGYGIAEDPSASAIDRARKPYIDALFKRWPHARLTASGESVGLPVGQFGNSEVGHLNIGAGRIVWQELSRIDKSIRDGEFMRNPVLTEAMEAGAAAGRLHLMGLVSDGGVHSHIGHIKALLEMACERGIRDVFVHVFTDGRDTSPTSGAGYVEDLAGEMRRLGCGRIATVVGRYYAMDRDRRWERTETAYKALTEGVGEAISDPVAAIKAHYRDGVTDEFLPPMIAEDAGASRIMAHDPVIFMNIRGDRARQIIKAFLCFEDVPFATARLDPSFHSLTSYDEAFNGRVKVAFPPNDLRHTLGEVVSAHGLRQLRIAETEKYPHVTYFFNGGKEDPSPGETRIMIPSPKVATYDLQPEMSAPGITKALLEAMKADAPSLIVLNFANPDMVGHTGVMEAAVEAIETIDEQLSLIVPEALALGYRILVIADHGNADQMVQPDGSPHTAHTMAQVPALLAGHPDPVILRDGILADVAPTLLKLMGLEKPADMTGSALF